MKVLIKLIRKNFRIFLIKTGKYLEILFPFACVGFAAYAIKGKRIKGRKILQKNVKKNIWN